MVRQAGALHVVTQLVHQRIVNSPGLVGGRSGIRILDAGTGVFEHVAHAGARPRPHAEKNIVHKAQRVKPQHGWIDPAIDRDIRRTERGGLAIDRGAIFSRECSRGHEGKPGQ